VGRVTLVSSNIPLSTPVKSLCILRLSALGDITHALPVFHTIRKAWPETKITWIIGKVEYELVKGLEGVEFIIFDKKAGFSAYKKINQQLKNRQFDVLLHMQMSLRASMISLLIKAKVKIGFDRQRAKDLQWLFTNKKIESQKEQHVIDSFFGFTTALGIKEPQYNWDIPIAETDKLSAKKLLTEHSKYIVISPCSSKAYRNWNIQGYAAIADYLSEKYHYDIVLSGGNSVIEKKYAVEIIQACTCKPLDLIGKTNIKELLSIIKEADFMISPDSGPAHMATAMATPVIGLYATTNPDRARPYLSSDWVVNRYPDAISKKYQQNVAEVTWGSRVRDEWAMNLITIEDVKNMIEKFMQQTSPSK
jgi:heptosyltransferase I